MRLDQRPDSSCFNGSGLPNPEKRFTLNLANKPDDLERLRTVLFDPRARSSNPEVSNYKFLNESLDR
jgi:hypothetical protein